LENCYNPRLG